MRGVDDELRDEVFLAGLHAHAAGAAALLLAIDADGRALEVAGVGDGDGDLLVGDEVLEGELGGLVDDGGAACVAVLVADVFELLDDDAAEFLLGGEDGLVLGDVVADGAELVEELVDGELGEAVELQFEDGVDLAVAEDQRAGGVACELRGDAAAGEVDVVLAGLSLTPLSSVPRRLMVRLEKNWKRFSRASAREDDWRMILMTLSRWSSAIW